MACIRKDAESTERIACAMGRYGIKLIPSPCHEEPAEERIVVGATSLVLSEEKISRIDVAVIMSGDGDVLPAVRILQENRIPVWVIAWRSTINQNLKRTANRFITFEEVLNRAAS